MASKDYSTSEKPTLDHLAASVLCGMPEYRDAGIMIEWKRSGNMAISGRCGNR